VVSREGELPAPPPQVTEEWLRARNVGGALPQLTALIEICDYDPAWPALYARHAECIRTGLGSRAVAVEHVGSTAVPGLAAKFRIDVDLIVADPADENAYLPALEPDCDEHLRHLIFRDWLRAHPEDRELYAAEKRRVAAQGVSYMAEYANRKSAVVVDILRRAGLR
jgi:GrpB-like predicted nucleotidyltransferase (UPF0157 family)